MRTFSIYRGQSRTGIGEGPGHPPVPHGEQYLAADPPLDSDGELLSEARPWMTLDWRPVDEQALGDRFEAWAYFRHGDLRLVVRLAGAGVYDRRAAYFAHGRAFPVAEFEGACDPGTYLGCSEAFEAPWRDGQRSSRPSLPGPEIVRPAQVLAEPAVAGALLAHLYQGLVSGYPVVMAVPVADFEAGGPVHALVSFARAALPLQLKTDCRIRVFTRLPELFLRHLRANLVVVPENEAGNALGARRDATLLDRKGIRRDGRELSHEAAEYAEAVLRRVHRLPDGLLAFSGAIGEHLPQGRLPGEQELARIPAIYNLLAARTDPAKLGEWLKSSLVKQVAERPTGLAWDRLIRSEDWHGLAFNDLAEILLAEVSGEEAWMLVRLAEAEARRPERREIISGERLQSRWNELLPEHRPALLARLLGGAEIGRPLIAPEAAARLSVGLPLWQILEAGCAAPLLAAELEAGLLGQRRMETDELVAAASQDLRIASILSQATAAAALTADWAVRLLETTEERTAVNTAAEILPTAVASLAWRPLLPEIYGRLLRFSSLPRELGVPLAEALRRTDPLDPLGGFQDFLVLTELLVRTGAAEGRPAMDQAWEMAASLSDRDERREFLNRVADPGWQSLRPEQLRAPGGRLSLPWAAEFADLLLQTEVLRDVLTSGEIVRLAGDRPEIGSWLDSRMEIDPEGTTADLLQARRWSLWRSRSTLTADHLRRAALAWLTSEGRQGRSAPQARLEDWKQVMADLGELAGEEMGSLFSGVPARPRWPWITPFQDEQLQDLCRLAQSDFGALAELAEGLDRQRDLGYPIQGTLFEHVLDQMDPSQRPDLSTLAFLSTSPRAAPAQPLPPRQAIILFDGTQHLRERAAAVLRQSVKAFLDREPLAALQAAERLAPWVNDRDLLAAIHRWKARQPPRTFEGKIGEILQAHLWAEPKLAGAATPRSRYSPDPAVLALSQGAAQNGYWKRLEKDIQSYVSSNARGPHPVSGLAESLREALPRLHRQEREALEKRGWTTFAAVARTHSLVLRQPVPKGSPLPALEVAALLLPRLGIGRVGLRLLSLAAVRDHAGQPEWWESLLAGLAACRRCHGVWEPVDREEAALTLIHQAIPDLFPKLADSAAILEMIEQRMERIYHQRGVHLPRNLVPRAAQRAGAAP